MMKKLVSAEEAVSKVKDGSVIAVSGFNNALSPEYLLIKLFESWKNNGHPKRLFLEAETLPGTPGRGLDVIGKELINEAKSQDFIRGVLIPYFGFTPSFMEFLMRSEVEIYSWSICMTSYWFREIASGRPGLISRVGLNTFFDPRMEGGFVNEIAREKRTCKVDIIKLDGEEFLIYSAPKPDVSMIRGTTADDIGNITLEKEGIYGSVLAIAQAAKAQPKPGITVAQVERIAKFGSLNPQRVIVPGPLVDYVVKAPPEYHWQGGTIQFDPRISGTIVPSSSEELPPVELSFEKVIARRTLLEFVEVIKKLKKPLIVNVGVGIPALISNIIKEEQLEEYIYTTVESGPWGGVALGGPDFGLSVGPFAIIPMPDQFSVYEGGIVDVASLGFMQVDYEGNVNPSILPERFTGPGGFPVIAAGSPRVYFSGGFTAGKREIRIEDRKLKIIEDGGIKKFVKNVYKILFSGRQALKSGKEVLYITERAVFRLTENGLELEEYAPGVDVEKDIIKKMEFEPKISVSLKEMDRRIFEEKKMGVSSEIQQLLG